MKPGEGQYDDCPTWAEVWAKWNMQHRSMSVALLGTALCGWWMVQYSLFTVTGNDIPLWWDFLVALFLPRAWVSIAFALSLCWRCCYGSMLVNAALWDALLELAKRGG